MFTEAKLFQILDSAVKDISRRVAKIEVENKPNVDTIAAPRPCSIYTQTQGDYDLIIAICADSTVLKKIIVNMRHGAETKDEDIPVYMQEYLNILCGQVVSKVNQYKHLSAYFDIPRFMKGIYRHPSEETSKILMKCFYDSPCGLLELKVICK